MATTEQQAFEQALLRFDSNKRYDASLRVIMAKWFHEGWVACESVIDASFDRWVD